MKSIFYLLFISMVQFTFVNGQSVASKNKNKQEVKTEYGFIKGTIESSGVYAFKGIPFAAPPTGELRWKEPQHVKSWKGIKNADEFGFKPMQLPLFSDMRFRSKSMSEDCLYLNVWSPSNYNSSKFPVLVYFYGGGFAAGDGSELRYDGEGMAKKGIVAVTVNYRLGIFGFFTHPELTKESLHKASGNYGLLDQSAALKWVKRNIAAFGGDPERVTIAGESAGSMSVSAQMASSLARNLFSGAIGESGSMLGITPMVSLPEAEQNGAKFMSVASVNTLAELRKIPAGQLLDLVSQFKTFGFGPIVDGYFFSKSPREIYATGLQADVPLLAGWNSAEVNYTSLLGKEETTVENYKNVVSKLYGEHAEEFLKLYPATNNEEVIRAATDLASDRFIAYSTWKWIDLHSKTNGKAVYRYLYTHLLPLKDSINKSGYRGAPHASEIEYAMGNLSSSKAYNWNADDYKVSEIMMSYFANFIKTGNPNGDGLPKWFGLQSSIPKVMILDVNAHSEPEKNAKRYALMDSFYYP